MSAYRTDSLGWLDGDAGHVFRLRAVTRPLCRDRRFRGSHITCSLNAEHDGPHESVEGDRWDDDND